MPLRRIIKNVVRNYSGAQVKVREATSNDPWGPSSTLMTEIADLTYNVLAFTEIMQMLWKRLNDHGRNWRHVYKALVLLEYIIKTGSEKVAQQCRENIFAIQTLRDFQYVEETRDYGLNIREKARHLSTLLNDSERLKNERAKALKAKEKFAQNSAGVPMAPNFASTSPALPSILSSYPDHHSTTSAAAGAAGGGGGGGGGRYSGFGSPSSWSLEGGSALDGDLEAVRPTSSGEEQLQLELAMAISKVEHEQQMKALKGDEVKLQMALQQSKVDATQHSPPFHGATAEPWHCRPSELDAVEIPPTWGEGHQHTAWPGGSCQENGDKTCTETTAPFNNLFQPFLEDEFQEFSSMRLKRPCKSPEHQGTDTRVKLDTALNNLSLHEATTHPHLSTLPHLNPPHLSTTTTKTPRGKSPKDFLGENAGLVDLERLMSSEKPPAPFSLPHSPSPSSPLLRDESSLLHPSLNPFFPAPCLPQVSAGGSPALKRQQQQQQQQQHEKGPSFICNTFHPSSSSSSSSPSNHHTLPPTSLPPNQPLPLQHPTNYPTEFNPFL